MLSVSFKYTDNDVSIILIGKNVKKAAMLTDFTLSHIDSLSKFNTQERKEPEPVKFKTKS